jgi:biopolymer transport protein ExbB
MSNGVEFNCSNLRAWYLRCLMFLIAATLVLALPARQAGLLAWAQEKAEKAEEESADEPAADDGAAADEGTEDAAEGEATSETAATADESFLTWLVNASGPFGAMIGVESVILVALIVSCLMQFRREVFMPSSLIEGFEQKLQARDYQGAYELAKKDDSLLGRLLSAGLGRLSRGYEEAIAGMQEVGEDENMTLDHKLSYLSLIGTTGPMLGLLGTVQGMVQAFSVIARSTVSPKPSELANGITLALVTTLEGLIVAIPAVISFSLFKNRQGRLMYDVGNVAEGLMGRFASVGKQRPAAAPAAPAAGTPANPAG